MNILDIGVILLISGCFIIFWNRENVIKIFLGVEVALLGSIWNFVFANEILHLIDSYVCIFFILSLAAAEIAIGLGILILVYNKFGTIRLRDISHAGR